MAPNDNRPVLQHQLTHHRKLSKTNTPLQPTMLPPFPLRLYRTVGTHISSSILYHADTTTAQEEDTVIDTIKFMTYNALSLKEEPKSRGNQSHHSTIKSTGLITHFSQQLHQRSIDVCCVQESRLSPNAELNTKEFTTTHVCAQLGVGGLITFISRSPHIRTLQHRSPHRRIQATTLLIHNKRFTIVNTHAPVRDSPHSTHEEYQTCLLELLKDIHQDDRVIIATDLNARLSGMSSQFSCVGMFTTPRTTACHVKRLLEYFTEHEFKFANTYLAPIGFERADPDSLATQHAISTWSSPNHKSWTMPYQIDYIIVDNLTFSSLTQIRLLDWCELATTRHADHRAVIATCVIHSRKPEQQRPRPMHRRFVDDGHQQRYIHKLQLLTLKYEQQLHHSTQHPVERLHHIEILATHAMQITAPPRTRAPIKPWLTTPTLQLLHDLPMLRREKAKFHRGDESTLAKTTQQNKHLPFSYIHSTTNAIEVTSRYSTAIVIRRKQAHKMIRRDKATWTDSTCAHIADLLQHHKTGQAHREIRKLQRLKHLTSSHRVTNANGTVEYDPQKQSSIWLEHWCRHFNATFIHHGPYRIDNTNDISITVPPSSSTQPSDPQHNQDDSRDLQASISTIEQLLKALPPGKAVPNLLATAGYQAGRRQLAPYVTAVVNTIIHTGHLHPALHGSVVVPVPKKNTLTTLPCNFRPIQLQRLERKICGRYLLTLLNDHIKISTTQHCLGSKAGTDSALFTLNQMFSHFVDKKCSFGAFFVDLSAAYDTVLHHLLYSDNVQPHHNRFTRMIERIGHDSGLAERAAAYITQHPDSLINSTMPPLLHQVLQQWLHSWMTTGQLWKSVLEDAAPDGDCKGWKFKEMIDHRLPADYIPIPCLATDTGVKQGDPLSTLLFTTYMSIALHYIMDQFTTTCDHNSWEVIPKFPVPNDRQLLQQGHHTQPHPSPPRTTVSIPHLDYADDVVFVVINNEPKTIIQASKALILHIIEGFHEFGLKTNLAQDKSALLIKLQGPQSRGIWQYLKNQHHDQASASTAHAPTTTGHKTSHTPLRSLPLRLNDLVTVHITQHYKYLGKHVSANLNCTKEVSMRKQCANAAFSNHSSILTSSHSPIHTKLNLYKSLVLPHLLQQLHTTSTLTTSQVNQLAHLHVHFIKRICRLHVNAPLSWFFTHDATILQLVGEQPLQHYIMQRRLSYMRKIIMHNDDILRAMSTVCGAHSIWSSWFNDLNLLRSLTPSLEVLPVASRTSFTTWLHFIVPADATWAALLKLHTTPQHTPARKETSLTLTS
eukprot:2723597-Amphidinium_carterae.1